MTDNESTRYLRLLNLKSGTPTIDLLRRIVREHMVTVPFENISKLLRWKSTNRREIPDSMEYLDGIEEHHFGGTCYTNNYYLNQLLEHLGYNVRLCGADMNRPDVHIVSIVAVGGREFLVDVGYAAPFIEPLPRDLSVDFVVSFGTTRYLLRPQDAEGRSRLELYRDGTLRHSYVVKSAPRRIEEFEPAIADSFRPSATFMNALLITRYGTDRSQLIHNMEFIETNGELSQKKVLRTIDELVGVIQGAFGMPPALVYRALEGFTFQGDAWS